MLEKILTGGVEVIQDSLIKAMDRKIAKFAASGYFDVSLSN